MAAIHLPEFEKSIECFDGETILEALQRHGFLVQADCAGVGICGTCKVRMQDCQSPFTDAEIELLTEEEKQSGVRLACQVKPEHDISLHFYQVEQEQQGQILTDALLTSGEVDPSVKSLSLDIQPPEINTSFSDLENLLSGLPIELQNREVSLDFLRRLPVALRENQFAVELIYNDCLLLDVSSPKRPSPLFGVAIDLGTTTVVAKLINLRNGVIEAVAATLNPQQAFGADVISRIGYAQQNPEGGKLLQEKIITALNDLLHSLCTEILLPEQAVYHVVIAGNTVMGHLLLGLETRFLAEYPYTPTAKYYPTLRAKELGLNVHPDASVELVPVIGRFVGGDTTAMILATALHERESLTLAIDIGTNGEIVLGNRERIMATSAAAGPAFEGARIRCGMRATNGAIDRISLDSAEIRYHTIANEGPIGICGSGIICAIGELVHAGFVNSSGMLSDQSAKIKLPGRVRPLNSTSKENIFVLYENGNHLIYVSQRDVREVQLAKSAIRTGIEILMQTMGVSLKDIDQVLLAGAFGNFLDRRQALRIGLLPAFPLEKIKFVGNAACQGAEKMVLSNRKKNDARKIAERTQYVELASHPDFQDLYAENMFFPEST